MWFEICFKFSFNLAVLVFSDLASGNSIDYAYEKLNIPATYTIELRGTFPDGGDVPTDQIIPNALEIIDGLVAMIKEAEALNYL